MAFRGLASFIEVLEKEGELIRIKDFVSPDLMITEIADRFSKQEDGGKALLFEDTGTDFPLLINAMGSEKRISLAFGRNSINEIENEIEELLSGFIRPKESIWDKLKLLPNLKELSSMFPKKLSRRGRCQEFVISDPDLGKLPVLKCWPEDGGRFITLPCVHTRDPDSEYVNLGMYRMQVFGKNETGMHWHKHKTGASHFEKYRQKGHIMPVSVVLGGDPVYTYAATAPMPEKVDEYLLAGFLRKKPVRLIKCLTNDLYVPDDADIVIEGYVDPSEEFILEGPFGDHTGFYSLTDYYPRFHVTCITHRRGAVYPATIVGVPPMEDAYIGKATERIFFNPVRMLIAPEIIDMDLPFTGVAHNLMVIKIEKKYPGQAVKVAHALWGAGQMMFNKIMVIVDCDIDIHDYHLLGRAIRDNFDPRTSLNFSKGPLDVLDHSSAKFAFGSKLCIDLTRPLAEEKGKIEREYYPPYEFDNRVFSEIDEIAGVKSLQMEYDIPVILLSVDKGSGFSRKTLKDNLAGLPFISSFKLLILFDKEVDLNDLSSLIWLLGANLDPQRDISSLKTDKGNHTIFVDATFKTLKHDDFQRDWPNVVIMDDATITAIDRKWEALGLGTFIGSPSLKYRLLVRGNSAIRS